ncbi:MAG: LPS translocon maturation chaperone LptM [Gammaproteobacteria bacterium]
MKPQSIFTVLSLSACLLLVACGQRGPLYLPTNAEKPGQVHGETDGKTTDESAKKTENAKSEQAQ